MSHLLIHFGELSTKGGNRKLFINKLAHNIRHALKKYDEVKVTADHDHIHVYPHNAPFDEICSIIKEIPGIQRVSIIESCSKELEDMQALALKLIKEEKGNTFKINTKRVDKTYPLDSYGISRALAGHILKNASLGVDVHNPDISLNVDLRRDCVFMSCHSFMGAGGYPLGMNGKVLLLLSGGIDSPVAAYELIRRGIRIECVHFASPPYTSSAVLYKLDDIIKELSSYQEDIKLHVIPFTKLQEQIYKNVDESYCITVMRRMMVRIAVEVAKKEHCLAIATGESIGQVASQTLESMQVINEVTNYPIIRPLAVKDKLSIIETAKKINTYEISIRPYEDCCTIFSPKNPKTKPQLDHCYHYERQFDWETILNDAVNNREKIFYKDGEKKTFEE